MDNQLLADVGVDRISGARRGPVAVSEGLRSSSDLPPPIRVSVGLTNLVKLVSLTPIKHAAGASADRVSAGQRHVWRKLVPIARRAWVGSCLGERD